MPDGDYAGFVERNAPAADRSGPDPRPGGRGSSAATAGVHRFTVGQRRGLGLTSARPLYVLAVRAGDARGRGRGTRRSSSPTGSWRGT